MFNNFMKKSENKTEQEAMVQKAMVRIRILPLKGIGGVGHAGDTSWMTKEEADRWVAEGYVEILPDADEPVASVVADSGESDDRIVEQGEVTVAGDESKGFEMVEAAKTIGDLYAVKDAFPNASKELQDAVDIKGNALAEAWKIEAEHKSAAEIDHALWPPENTRD